VAIYNQREPFRETIYRAHSGAPKPSEHLAERRSGRLWLWLLAGILLALAAVMIHWTTRV